MKIVYYLNTSQILFECESLQAAKKLQLTINDSLNPAEIVQSFCQKEKVTVILSTESYRHKIRISTVIKAALSLPIHVIKLSKEQEYGEMASLLLRSSSVATFFEIRTNDQAGLKDRQRADCKVLFYHKQYFMLNTRI